MFTINNNFKVFVQNTTNSNVVTSVDLSAIVAGTIVPIGDDDIPLATSSDTITGAAPKTIKFAQKTVNGGLTHFSGGFKVKDIVAMSYKAYTAPVEQISYVGYNGTSGNISAIDYNEYILGTVYLHDDMIWSEQIKRKPYLYTTADGATSSEVAFGLMNVINNDSSRNVVCDLICNTPVNAAYDLTNNTTVVNGSNIINVATDLTYNTAAGTLAVGDYIRFAADALNGTLALTDPIYKVMSTEALVGSYNVTLDRPVTVASGTWTDAGDGIQVITAAQYAVASLGLKFTGLTLDWIAKGIFPYKQVSFRITLKGFGSTPQSTTNATYPNGYYKQVSDLEWFSQFGSDGIRNATVIPIPTGRSETDSTGSTSYNVYTIKYKGTAENDAIVGQSNLTSTIYFFAPSGAHTYIYTNMLTPLSTLAGVSIQ